MSATAPERRALPPSFGPLPVALLQFRPHPLTDITLDTKMLCTRTPMSIVGSGTSASCTVEVSIPLALLSCETPQVHMSASDVPVHHSSSTRTMIKAMRRGLGSRA